MGEPDDLDGLRAAVASGVATSIPLGGGAPDPATAPPPPEPSRLAELFGRSLTPDEIPVAQQMLAAPTSWAADPDRQRQFLETELAAWTVALAGGDDTTNPYPEDHPDPDLRMVWGLALARAQSVRARARRAAAAGPINRTVRFWSAQDGHTIGTVTLTAAGELVYSNPSVAGILRGRVAMFGAERAFLSYVDWSNGYVGSSEI